MRKLLPILCLSLFAIFSLFFLFSKTAHAQDNLTLSLSDAVLADLALHNYLDYISIDFKDKKSPNTITINENRQWLPASTVKLFVAMYAADQITKKNISLNDWVTIDDKNVVSTELETSQYPVLTAGLTTTVDILLQKMITQSDNTAYNTLLDLLDRQKVTEYVQNLGLKHTIIGSKLNLDDNQTQYEYTIPGFNINTTTASDYEKAYELIDQGKVPGSTILFGILKQQKIQNMIPALLPIKELTIAHKTGDLDPLYHDGGIIIGNNKHYILTIFTNLGNPNIIAHLSQLIFTKNYKLVGAQIPDKNTQPEPQALDPLVVNPEGFQSVLAATTIPINIPIPQITAADLGITPKDLSLVIPDSKLPPVIIASNSPLHGLVNAWYGIQEIVAIGAKNRQQVSLNFAKQLLAEAKQEQKNGQTQAAGNTFTRVEQILKHVATDPIAKPDSQMQVDIKAVSDTQFAALKTNVDSAKNDSARIEALQEIANTVKDHLKNVQPNIPEANAATATSNQPLIAHVVDVKDNNATVVTAAGTTITVPLTQDTKVITKNDTLQTSPSPTPEETAIPSVSGSPTPSETPTSPTTQPEPSVQKGATIALVGTIKGKVFTPSVIVTNLHKELAAPQPVTVVKVNTKNNTMVVSENGTPIQVDLGPQTPIKAKDTNVPLQSIQPGSVVVVHGTEVQQVTSDNPQNVPTVSPSISPINKQQTTPTNAPSGKPNAVSTTPETSNGPSQTPSGKTTPAPSGKTETTPVNGKPLVTSAPSGAKQSPTAPTTQPIGPKVIQATSVQVVQQKPTGAPTVAKPSQPSSSSKPAAPQPPAQNPPAAPAVNNKGKTPTK